MLREALQSALQKIPGAMHANTDKRKAALD
jgi:hypothetical protein